MGAYHLEPISLAVRSEMQASTAYGSAGSPSAKKRRHLLSIDRRA